MTKTVVIAIIAATAAITACQTLDNTITTRNVPDPTAIPTSPCEPGDSIIVTREYPIDVIYDNLTAQADPEVTATPLTGFVEVPCE